MKIKRTILFTSQDNIDRCCVIDEDLNSNFFRPSFEINEFVFGLKLNRFNRFGIMDENREIIKIEEYKRRKIENGYIEIPNEKYGYDDFIGVFQKKEKHITLRKYFEFTEEYVPVRIQGAPPSKFSVEIFRYIIQNQSSLKQKIIERLFEDYSEIKKSVKDVWDEKDYIQNFPDLRKKDEVLKMVDFRGISITDEYFFNHEASDKSKFNVVGECFWDEEHGFEIYFDGNFEIL